MDGVRRAGAGPELSESFVGALRSLLHDLSEHERRENELILDLVGRDIGAGD